MAGKKNQEIQLRANYVAETGKKELTEKIVQAMNNGMIDSFVSGSSPRYNFAPFCVILLLYFWG